ncbi:hypothetical protein ACGFYV_08670 [Streptomyces sp. NPDC048297]|uniref:hypothetical protein n=1 Tax=Streptomyces sp. NPDC048297 TaxID=3365531 RepID=UPI0037133904
MASFFDDTFPAAEQLPRQLVVRLAPWAEPTGDVVRMLINGRPVGDEMDDLGWFKSKYEVDDDGSIRKLPGSDCPPDVTGARWHDALHVAFAACLGWSPVLRMLAGYQRQSPSGAVYEEDTDRAVQAEEAITLAVFTHARAAADGEGPATSTPALLASVKEKASGLEVSARSDADWALAVDTGIACIHQMWANKGGTLTADLLTRSVVYAPLTNTSQAEPVPA